jgi:hypothetical protein
LCFGITGVATFNIVLVSVYFVLGLGAVACSGFGLIILRRRKEERHARRLAIWGIGLPLGLLVLAPGCMGTVMYPVEPGARTRSQSFLKQIALALHGYHAEHHRFPPAAICATDGRPLLSWRVAILPFIEQEALYRQFRLDEPWDSPHNIGLLEQMPAIYGVPNGAPVSAVPHTTFYQAIVGPGTAFEPGATIHLPKDFPDGSSNTIVVVEAAHSVPWTKPEEIVYDPKQPLPALGGIFTGAQPFFMFGARQGYRGFNAALGDGSVRFIQSSVTSEETLRRLIVRNDDKPLGSDW